MASPRGGQNDLPRIRSATPAPQPSTLFSARGLSSWHMASRQPVNVPFGQRDPVSCVAWSCDGKRLASCGPEKSVRIWTPERNTDMHLTTSLSGGHDQPVHYLAWHPNSPFLLASVSRGDKKMCFWDTRQPKPTFSTTTPREFMSIEYSPSGEVLLALSRDDGLYLAYSTSPSDIPPSPPPSPPATSSPKQAWTFGPRHEGYGQVNHATWNHAGDLILLSETSGTLEMVQPERMGEGDNETFTTWEKVQAHVTSCWTVALDPRGIYVATGGADAIINLFDTREWLPQRTYDSDASVREMAFSHDGEYIASASDDAAGIDIWETESGQRLGKINIPGPAATIAWHPTKYILASGGDGGANARAGWISFFGL